MTNQGTRLMTLSIFGAVFVSGALIGVALDRQGRPLDEPLEPAQETSEEDPGERRERPRIIDQVGLTDIQQVQVDSIIHAGGTAMRERQELHEVEYRRERYELVLEIREDIIGVLTPEQGERYRSLLAQRDSARNERSRREEADAEERNR